MNMDKKEFDSVTKEIFLAYGFKKKRDFYNLVLDEITITCRLYSWNLVRSFNYWFSLNSLYDNSIPYEKRYGMLVAVKMEHTPAAQGYHKSEIKYEDYSEEEYRRMLTYMLHTYFDPYKTDAIGYIKEFHVYLALRDETKEALGIH